MKRIYLDHAATTPMFPEVREAMQPWLNEEFGNASSLYAEGRRAKDAIDEARETLSDTLGCMFAEVLFTSSGTEAANLSIIGAALCSSESKRNRVLLSAVEHHCVLHTRPILERLGYAVSLVPVGKESVLDLDHFKSLLGDDVLLASVMQANNETGAIQPVREASELCREHGVLFLCDAVQTFLSHPNEHLVEKLDADLLALSAHKINGPKGVGAIYIRAGVKLQPLALGGGQEREMRAGTENVAGIVGFGHAVRAHIGCPERMSVKGVLRQTFLEALDCEVELTCPHADTLSGHLHFRVPGIDAETMLIRLDRMGVSASSGAACSSGSLEPSHVLLACGYDARQAKEGLRFTFGWPGTVEESVEAAKRVSECVRSIRETSH